MVNLAGGILTGILAIACFAAGCLQLQEKGPLLNNAYLYASKQDREKMDKKPHYRQSGVVFVLLGTIFALYGVECLLETGWLHFCGILLVILTVVYAVVSSVCIEKRKQETSG